MNLITTEKIKEIITPQLNEMKSIQEVCHFITRIETLRRGAKECHDKSLRQMTLTIIHPKFMESDKYDESFADHSVSMLLQSKLHEVYSEVYFLAMAHKTEMVRKLNQEQK